jgi:hypothetical protein
MFFTDPDVLGDIANITIVVLAVLAVVGFWYAWKLTGASGFLWKASAITYILIARILLVSNVEPFVKYSAPFALPFYILIVIGIWLTVFKLRTVYIRKKEKIDDN